MEMIWLCIMEIVVMIWLCSMEIMIRLYIMEIMIWLRSHDDMIMKYGNRCDVVRHFICYSF